jgi:hypothetical protein
MGARFGELTTTRSGQTSAESVGMEYARENYSHSEKRKGMDFHLGMEGMNSNEHGEERNEYTTMAETIKNFQKYVQSHKADNERLIKSKEQQDSFNMKLLECLNRIEKKLAKESDSSRYESHKSLEEKREVKSSSKHHQHSHKRAGNSSSLSPARRYKRSGVDELRGEMKKIKPPTFDGEQKKDEDVETWLLGMRKYFQLHNYSSHAESRIIIYQLKGKASMWWDQLLQVQHIVEKSVTWREFKKYFEKKYLTKRYYDKKMKEFFELKLVSTTIYEYERRFLELVSFIKDETIKIQ